MLPFRSRMPCAHCGEAVTRGAAEVHHCDPRRRTDFQMAALRPGLEAFEHDLDAYLAGNQGRFETWLAQRDVRRSA